MLGIYCVKLIAGSNEQDEEKHKSYDGQSGEKEEEACK